MKNLFDLLKFVEYKIINKGDNPLINSIEIDSRKIKQGDMFICIKGINIDQHIYANDAIKNGAVAIIAEVEIQVPKHIALIIVKNTRKALSLIAAAFFDFPAQKLKLIGVTGTNGKTTVSNYIKQLLKCYKKSVGLIGTIGIQANDKTVNLPMITSTSPDPMELHRIFAYFVKEKIEYVIMEVSSHALEFHKVLGLEFETGVYTNLSQDHLDFHGTMENYAKAKAKLFTISKRAVFNIDDNYTNIMQKAFTGDNIITYGKKNADLTFSNVKIKNGGQEFLLNKQMIFLPILGHFNIYNALAAIGSVINIIPMEIIIEGIEKLQGVPGRIQTVNNNKNLTIVIDYAHTPDGLENLLLSVREFTKGKIITVFGCGGDRDKGKRSIMGEISCRLSDYSIITSDNPRTEEPISIINDIKAGFFNNSYKIIPDRASAIQQGINMINIGDSLVIAGKGHEDYQIIGETKYNFSDYEKAKEYLNEFKN